MDLLISLAIAVSVIMGLSIWEKVENSRKSKKDRKKNRG